VRPAGPIEEPKTCATATELQCIESERCTLVQPEATQQVHLPRRRQPLRSRHRQGGGGGDIKQQCESKPGCEFHNASCYCPPNVNCVCGGGPPAQCVEKKKQ
jgi:hypothetical protein